MISQRLKAALAAAGAGACLLAAAAAHAGPQYRIVHTLTLPGEGGWDYLTFEAGGRRLFIAHGSHVDVIDTHSLARVGEIPDTPGVHGIALAPDLGRGYISAGAAGIIVVFDLKSLARLKDIKATGENPDAIVYDAPTRRVFSFNGRGRNATVIDALTNEVIGSIALDAKPEFARSDGRGHVYVNLEDRNSIAAIDTRALTVLSVWPITGCEAPSGLALDAAGERLFPVCGNRVMAVVDARNGRVLASAPIGEGPDAAGYDPALRLAFASCGEGVLTAVSVGAGGAALPAQSLQTERGARTMALDERSHRIFLVTADFGPAAPASEEHPHPRPRILSGTLRLLVLAPGHAGPRSHTANAEGNGT
jgi:DNA-binding beta-propeller fold protein YncE